MTSYRWIVFVISCLLCNAAGAIDQRLKVDGTWDGQTFNVDRIRQRNPDKDVKRIRISGAVTEISEFDEVIQIGPVRMRWQRSQADAISTVKVGDTIEVDAIQGASSSFTIVAFESTNVDSVDSIELIGALTGYSSDDDWTELRLAGIPARTSRRLFSNGRLALQRLDDRRPDNQFTTNIGNVRTTIGGEIGIKADADGDRDLDNDAADEQLDADVQVQLEAFFEVSDTISGFAELKVEQSQRYEFPLNRTRSEFNVDRGEMWLYLDQPFDLPAGIQIGRQNFAEDREWWWDTDLDAIRLYVTYPTLSLEVAIAEELGRESLTDDLADIEDQDITRFIAKGHLRLSSELNLDTFFLHQSDHSSSFNVADIIAANLEDEDDANLTWVGVRLSGTLDLLDIFETEYWIDIARVSGEETHYEFDELPNGELGVGSVLDQDRSGTAIDVGGTLTLSGIQMGVFSEPALTLAYASGSGDESSDGTFRQTGLNDNNGRFNGVDRFRYYGELVRPELENLSVATLSLGLLFNDESSLEIIYHHYAQNHLSTRHSLRIDQRANGGSLDLGDELNLVFGIEEWEHVEIEAIGGIFSPGRAFTNDDPAWFVALKMDYNF